MSENGMPKQKQRFGSPHDKFGRKFLQYVAIATDLLRFYADSFISKHVDVDALQPAPTHGISDELKEVIMDVSFVARLRDAAARSEVLFALEHKSSPSPRVALQVGTQAFLALYSSWTDAEYTDSKSFVLPIPIMVVLYHGVKDWAEKEIQFQDLFQDIPPDLRDWVPRFKVMVINLRRFQYGNLPGRPVTQAFVESLMRAMDGTFAEELESVFQHVRDAGLDETQTWDFIQTIARYCAWSVGLTKKRFEQAIQKIFEGKEGIEMLQTIPEGMVKDGYEVGVDIGRVEGKIKSKVEDIILFLEDRFGQVPDEIVTSLNGKTDLVVLRSLLLRASKCDSLAEFGEALK